MQRSLFVGLVVGWCVAACGDNSKECGPGTDSIEGVCTPSASCGTGTKDDGTGRCVPDGSIICANGTIFDAATGTCQIDPTACQGGTVPINGACMDPDKGLTVDATEGPEPNGLGVLGETSTTPAGIITLKPNGTSVIHGTIVPYDRDGDGRVEADVDAYVFTTTGPTYLHVIADGLNGLAGGFVIFPQGRSAADPLSSWKRLGIDLAGAASARDVYVPAPGNYVIAIADSRTFVLGGSPAGASVNGPAFEYYVSITVKPVPEPTPLAPTNGKIVVTDHLQPGNVKFYAVPMDMGFNDVLLEMPPDAVAPTDAVNGSVVLMTNNTFRNVGSEHQLLGSTVTLPAELIEGGIVSSDEVLLVVDPEYDWNLDPSPFRLTVTVSTAMPLDVVLRDQHHH